LKTRLLRCIVSFREFLFSYTAGPSKPVLVLMIFIERLPKTKDKKLSETHEVQASYLIGLALFGFFTHKPYN